MDIEDLDTEVDRFTSIYYGATKINDTDELERCLGSIEALREIIAQLSSAENPGDEEDKTDHVLLDKIKKLKEGHEDRVKSFLEGKPAIGNLKSVHNLQTVRNYVERGAFEMIKSLKSELERMEENPMPEGSLEWIFAYHGQFHDNYVERFFEVTPVLSPVHLPDRIASLVSEARLCYTIDQPESVFAIGRAILEFAMNDIFSRTGLSPNNDISTQNMFWDYPPSERAKTLYGDSSPRQKQFKRLFHIGSCAIHSNPKDREIGPIEFLNEVVRFVSDDYSIHAKRISARESKSQGGRVESD